MVSWKQRADIDDHLVALAVDALLKYLRTVPEPTYEQTALVMHTLATEFGKATAATAYQALRTSRELHELWDVLPEPVIADPVERDATYASTAWALQTRTGKQLTAEQIKQRLGGTLTRLVREPGRRTVFEATKTAGSRWARVPGPYACDFCLMLASRGAVYESEKSASTTSGDRGTRPEGLRFHDRCSCHIVESFSDHDLPGITKALNREWYEVTWDSSGPVEDQLGAWKEHVAITRPDHTTIRPRQEPKPHVSKRAASGPLPAAGKPVPESFAPLQRPAEAATERKAPLQLPSAAPHELATVERLRAAGFNPKFRLIDNTPGVKNPDLEINGKVWEMKSPTGKSEKNTISEQFKRAGKQASRLVLDLQRCGLGDQRAVEQAVERFHHQGKISDLIILQKDGSLTRVTK